MKPTAQRRRDRRDVLDNLLSRILRGRDLTPDEAALLAATVREEQRAYDQTRRSLAETGSAYGKHRAAADTAIREMEQRALDAEEQLTAYRSVLGPRPLDRIRDAEQRAAQAEHRINILTAVDEGRAHGARRIMDERDQAQQRAAEAEGQLDSRRRKLAAILAKPAETPFSELTEYAARVLTANGERILAATQRADKAEEFAKFAEAAAERAEGRLARIRDMADAWETRLPATIRTTTAAEAVRNAANGDYRPVMFGIIPAPADDDQAVTVAPGVAVVTVQPTAGTQEFAEQERARFERLYTRETVRADKAEAERAQAERFVESWKGLAKHRRTLVEAAHAERDRFEAAWHSARQRAAEQRTLADSRQERLRIRARRILEWEQRAKQAERSATAWEDTARLYATNMDDARHKADRYRLAWHACRRDRKADRAAMAAELPLIAVGPPRRAPEVITDRATIRASLDEPAPAEESKPEPCRRHPMCPCNTCRP